MNLMDTLYLVIPCYNEEEVLPETSKQLLAVRIRSKPRDFQSRSLQMPSAMAGSSSTITNVYIFFHLSRKNKRFWNDPCTQGFLFSFSFWPSI